jgi:hypothetical protein
MRLFLVLFVITFTQVAYSQEDNPQLLKIYNLDQKMRTKENMKNWPMFSALEERDFRIAVFKLLANNKIRTKNDYFHASIILLHTFKYGHENYILAGHLAGKAIELGHEKGHFALDAAISGYSLSEQLASDEWTLYSLDGKLITVQNLKDELISNPSKSNITPQK